MTALKRHADAMRATGVLVLLALVREVELYRSGPSMFAQLIYPVEVVGSQVFFVDTQVYGPQADLFTLAPATTVGCAPTP